MQSNNQEPSVESEKVTVDEPDDVTSQNKMDHRNVTEPQESTTVFQRMESSSPTLSVKSEPDELQVDDPDTETDTDEDTEADTETDNTDCKTEPFPEMNLSKIIMDKESPEEVIEKLIGYKSTVKCRVGGTPERGVNESASARVGDVSAKGNGNDESQNRTDDQGNKETRNDVPLITELKLNKTTKTEMENHASQYRVKLFVNTSTNDSDMSLAVNSIVEGTQRMETLNTSRSFMIFFFKDGDPDMFVMTSGQAYRKVQSKSCPRFPKKIARRLLEFKTIEIETRNVTGKQEQTRTIFRPNCPEVPNIFDLIHVIVHSYTASPTFFSSLYDLPGFEVSKDCKFTIKPFFLKAHTTLFFTEMLSFIKHVADIDKGKDTNLSNHRILRSDTVESKKLHKFKEIKEEQLKSDLDRGLLKYLDRSEDKIIAMKGGTGQYSLHLKWKRGGPFTTLTFPTTFHEILNALKDNFSGFSSSFSWIVDNVMVQNGKKRKSIRNFINIEKIDFRYKRNSYIYSFVSKEFIKVDKSVTLQEKDDGSFKCFEFIQEERDQQKIDELEKGFSESLKHDHGLFIPLSLPDLSEWMDTGTFELHLATKKNPEREWPRMPSTLNEVLEAVDESKINLSFGWLRNIANLSMQFKAKGTMKRKSITDLLVHQIWSKNKPYIFWHGKWLYIKAEFVSIVAETFENYLQNCTLSKEIILPLPWVYTEEAGNKTLNKSYSFKMKDLIKFMKLSFPKVTKQTCMHVLEKISQDKKTDLVKGIRYRKHQYEQEEDYQHKEEEIVMLMFLRVHSNVVELLYNASYILYDRYLNNPGEGYIVGDQICTRNIEMFDILKFDRKKTYLIHVKDKFGNTVRDVCSQIRNSAKLLFNSLTTHSTHSLLEEMWEKYTLKPDGNKPQYFYRRATMNKMNQLTKEKFLSLFNTKKRQLLYVLAVRDEKKDEKLKEEETMTKVLRQHYGDEQANYILEELKKQDYVSDQFFGRYILTDKFRVRKDEFIKTMKVSSEEAFKSVWADVFKLLKKYLPRTDSTIAQLEIVELFNEFDNHYGKKLTLRIFFLPTSLEDLEKGFQMKEE